MAAPEHPPSWIDAAQLEALGTALADPPEVRGERGQAARLFRELPLEPDPLYRQYGYFQGVDLAGIDPVARGPAVPAPAPSRNFIQILHDSHGTRSYVPDALVAQGVGFRSLSEIWSERGETLQRFLSRSEKPTDRLTALSAALLNRGYELEIPDRLSSPVRIQDITILGRAHEATSIHRRVRVGAETEILLTQEVYSTSASPEGQRFIASSLDLDAGPGSKTVVLDVHAPDRDAIGFYRRHATTGNGARIAWIWLGLGGRVTKARNDTVLSGNGSVVHDLQTFYGDGHQSYDSAIRLTHTGTDTHGESITRGVFNDEARGMSRGLVRIERDARKTISFISEHAMLLARGARSDTIPILEILCPDVKATHSTSVAPVDPEKIFYLESRGISREESIRMITEGFLSYVLERAPVDRLRDIIQPMLQARWERRDLYWTADGSRALPALDVTGTDAAPDWRFDAKLR